MQTISSITYLHNATPEIIDKKENLETSNRSYKTINNQEEDVVIRYRSLNKSILKEFKVSYAMGLPKIYVEQKNNCAPTNAFTWAMSDKKNKALLSYTSDFDVSKYKALTPRMGCLFTSDKLADVLIKLVEATKDKLVYKESYMMNIQGRENIALYLKRKGDNFTISFYDGSCNQKGYLKYRFNFNGNIQASLKNIANNILNDIAKNSDIPPNNNNCALYSLDTTETEFDISVFSNPEYRKSLIVNSSYAKVDPKYFCNPDGSDLGAIKLYDNIPEYYRKNVLSNLLIKNCPWGVDSVTTQILEANSKLPESDQKTDLINIDNLYLAFTKENTEAVVAFISAVAKSSLTPENRAEVFINHNMINIGTRRSGILYAIQMGKNEIAMKYIKAMFDDCHTDSNNIFQVITETNTIINSPSFLRYIINSDNLEVFTFYIKSILASTKIIVGEKLILLLDKINKSTVLDSLIDAKKHDLAVSYLTEILNDTELNNNLKLTLLATDKLSYGCKENLMKLASDPNQVDAIFATVKSVLTRTDISVAQKISKLQAKSYARPFWEKLLSYKYH